MQSYWLHTTNELSVSRVQVAADYSDSVPDSSKHNRNYGYHPLEELKERKKNKNKNMKLADAEIARTVVEVLFVVFWMWKFPRCGCARFCIFTQTCSFLMVNMCAW